MKKYFLKTFGCQANKADSERIGSALEPKNSSLSWFLKLFQITRDFRK